MKQRLLVSVLTLVSASLALATPARSVSAKPASTPAPAPVLHLQVPQNNDRVEALAVSPDGKLAAAVDELHLRLFSLESGELVRTLSWGTSELVRAVAFAKDGATVFVSSYDRKGTDDTGVHLRRVDVKTGDVKDDLPPVPSHAVATALAVSPDGKTLALNDGTSSVLVDLATKKPVWKVAEAQGGAIAFSPDGKLVISGGGFQAASRHFQVLDAATGAVIKKVAITGEKVHALSFSPDGKLLAVGAAGAKLVELFDTTTWAVSKTIATADKSAPRCAFSPDGKTLAVGDKEGTLTLFDVAAGTKLAAATKPGHFGAFTPAVFAVAFTPNGKFALKAGWGGIDVVDAKGAHRVSLLSFANKDGSSDWVAVTPDGTYAASATAEKTWIRWWTKDGSLADEKLWPKDKKKPDAVKTALKP